ncbi:Unknown protein [Striga hermonthica]|uniref:DUF4283 domain-containing protein n=1 Tax=Striga hermonthica TaxID=68872 RepID=A0A9N7NQC7_STRHE|nr:Unknown protein [Striga hermonthica]
MSSGRFGVPAQPAGSSSSLRSANHPLSGTRSSDGPISPAPTVASVNTGSNSEASKKPPVVAPIATMISSAISQPEVTGLPVSGILKVLFSPLEVSKMSEDLKYSLVGKFSFGKLSNEAIRSDLALWSFTGCKIFFLQVNHVLIKADDPNTSTMPWLKREIFILNFPMRIFKWSVDFDFIKEPPTVLVWIQIPALPLHCFELKVLQTIANIFGTLLKVDDATLHKTRVQYARFCVAPNLESPHPTSIYVSCGNKSAELIVEFDAYRNIVPIALMWDMMTQLVT